MRNKSAMKSMISCLGLLLLVGGCQSASYDPTGEGPDVVDIDQAATREYEDLIELATKDLLAKANITATNQGRLVIAIMTVDSTSAEVLGPERRPYLQNKLTDVYSDAYGFTVISSNMIKVALDEAGTSSEEKLFLPAERRKFVGVLEGMGQAPEYLLFPKISSSRAKSSGVLSSTEQVTYALDLQLCNAKNGEVTNGRWQSKKTYKNR